MARIITHADVAAVPDGGVLTVPEGAQLTPLAEERARARGVTLTRGPEPGAAFAQAVTEQVLRRLGGGALGDGEAEHVIREVMASLDGVELPQQGGVLGPPALDYCAAYLEEERARARRRAVITTTGKNGKGIVARLTAVVADLGGDILDISQTLVSDYFTMILVVDTAGLSPSFAAFKEQIEGTCRDLGIGCLVMHEDIVTSLSRV